MDGRLGKLKFSDIDNYSVVKEIILIFRKCTMSYLGVKRSVVCNILSDG